MAGIPEQAVSTSQATDPRELWLHVDASAVTGSVASAYNADANKAALLEGWNHALISKSSSVFTIELRRPSKGTPIALVTSLSASRLVSVTAISETAIEVTTTDLAGTPTDGDFFVVVKYRARNSRQY